MTRGVRKSLDGERIELTPERVAELKAARERCGLGAAELLRRNPDAPKGLTRGVADHLLTGRVGTVRKDHFEFLIETWDELAKEIGGKLTLTQEMRSVLREHIRRTGEGVAPLLRDAANIPDGLCERMIGNWLRRKTKTARADHWRYVIGLYEALPDASTAEPKIAPIQIERGYQLIPPEVVAELQTHRVRTGIAFARILAGRKDKPSHLTDNMIGSWSSGQVKIADPAHLNYVLRLYRSLPTKKK